MDEAEYHLSIDMFTLGRTLLFLYLCVLLVVSDGRQRIHDDEKPTVGLLQLDDANFLGTFADLGQQSYDWVLVEFYSHWCPACKAFQPDYKRIARHINKIIEEEDAFWHGKSGERPPRIAVARVDCPENKQLCDDFEISKYPTMLLDRPVHFASKTMNDMIEIDPKPRNKDSVVSELEKKIGRSLENPLLQGGELMPKEFIPQDVETLSVDERKTSILDGGQELNEDGIGSDIIDATIESFEYLKSRPLLKGGDARRALINWLQLLEKSHYISECRIGAQNAISALELAWPESANEVQDLGSLQDVDICGVFKQRGWSHCKGSYKDSRGYTCGLWMLFHSLSVRMPDTSENAGQEWLNTIKGFVQYFFQCKDCAEHFLKYINGFDVSSILSKRDAVLWFWKTHNKVNERLSEEQDLSGNGDPAFPHVQWPPKDLCDECYSQSLWNDEKVYAFLLEHYKGETIPGSDRPINKDPALRASGKESSWTQAFLIIAASITIIYHYLRHSKQYMLRKATRSMNKF